MRVQKVSLSPFHWKPRPSGVSLESPGVENILQVPGNGAEVDENYDARNGFSAILSVLNLS